MHPILFSAGPVTIYTYGFCIAVGALLGITYIGIQGKKEFNLTFDQSNSLFIIVVLAAVIGGKLFIIFENPSLYLSNPAELISGSGFVFYGSLIFAIPAMLWYFKKNKLPVLPMLDIMAIASCVVHGCGRIGCFMAGCCYGKPSSGFFGVIFTDPVCQAEPKGVPLIPIQLYEAAFIFAVMAVLLFIRKRKQFNGQVFLLYLIAYAIGRSVLELYRGDLERGYIMDGILSTSQLIALLMIAGSLYFYVKLKRKANLNQHLNS